MKIFKTLSALAIASLISFGIQAQTAAPAATTTTQSTTTKSSSKASTTTKNTDKVNPALKGPNGEVVYTGSRGGNYYINKSGAKTYLKK
jgi:colicin import membrane protein